jgi:hypothetical protein
MKLRPKERVPQPAVPPFRLGGILGGSGTPGFMADRYTCVLCVDCFGGVHVCYVFLYVRMYVCLYVRLCICNRIQVAGIHKCVFACGYACMLACVFVILYAHKRLREHL